MGYSPIRDGNSWLAKSPKQIFVLLAFSMEVKAWWSIFWFHQCSQSKSYDPAATRGLSGKTARVFLLEALLSLKLGRACYELRERKAHEDPWWFHGLIYKSWKSMSTASSLFMMRSCLGGGGLTARLRVASGMAPLLLLPDCSMRIMRLEPARNAGHVDRVVGTP